MLNKLIYRWQNVLIELINGGQKMLDKLIYGWQKMLN